MTRIRIVRSRGFCALALCFLWCNSNGPAVAQPSPATPKTSIENQVLVIRLRLQPARIRKPALKYPLLPPYLDQTSGNAVPLYYRAFLLLREPGLSESRTKAAEWGNQSFDELPFAEVRKHIARSSGVFGELHTAARRDRCEWDLPIRGNRDVIGLLMHDAQDARTAAQLLSINIRVQMRDGKFDDAVRSLQTGYSLGRHVSQIPLLVTGLIGMSVANNMTDRVEEMAELDGSPNLYWPLTALPQPLIDLRPAVGTELALPYQMFPFLRDADTAQRSAADWQQLLEGAFSRLRQLYGRNEKPSLADWGEKLGLTALAMNSYPAAKHHLLKKGRTLQQIERMSVAQVLAIHLADSYDDASQEISKWFGLPFPQVDAAMRRGEDFLAQVRREQFLTPVLAKRLMPNLRNAALAMHRADRRIAELRLIEALRDYAAMHNRRLPAGLSDLADIPIPLDPIAGQPFGYRLEGDTAMIEIAPPSQGMYGKRYVVTIAK